MVMFPEVTLRVDDRLVQDLLWEYACRHRAKYADEAFADELQMALLAAGFEPPDQAEVKKVEMVRPGE